MAAANWELEAESWGMGAGSTEPGAWSRNRELGRGIAWQEEPGAGTWEAGAGSGECLAGKAWNLEVPGRRNWEPGSWERLTGGAGSLGVPGRRSREPGSWEGLAGDLTSGDFFRFREKSQLKYR